MSLTTAIRSRLSAKISLTLAALLILLTALAGLVITRHQTAQAEALTLEKARVAAALGARQWGDVLDHAIDAGQLTVADVFDRSYAEVKGFAFGKQPKFHTRFDAFTDNAVLVFQDKYLDHEDFLFAVGVDENGYLPTHNTKFQKPLTGDAGEGPGRQPDQADVHRPGRPGRRQEPGALAPAGLPARHRRDALGRLQPDLREGQALGRLPGRRLHGAAGGAQAGPARHPGLACSPPSPWSPSASLNDHSAPQSPDTQTSLSVPMKNVKMKVPTRIPTPVPKK